MQKGRFGYEALSVLFFEWFPADVLAAVLVMIVAVNLWYRKMRSRLTPEECKALDEEVMDETRIW